jgi:3-deoxy-manno-octulosonate cytidylyltransferase (CMP-KDO synthetase)|nr:3-deoxy-manno-octulosonate cytidylyltransferase [Candidatus Krumholzibacteria bacterium]
MHILVVIPARYASTRFPGKALADLEGRPLIVRTVERAAQMKRADQVIVATDDSRILDAVQSAGFAVEMTGDHGTGTDRIGEIAARHPEAEIILNLQGDEPLLDPGTADRLVEAILADRSIDIGTLAHPFATPEEWQNPNNVKVLVDQGRRALYFSRACVPGVFPGSAAEPSHHALRHVGVYAFRRSALEKFLTLAPSPLERTEGLEQLRALENGMTIKVLPIDQAPVGVDTPEDLEKVKQIIRRMAG